jgi:hypothetical protein
VSLADVCNKRVLGTSHVIHESAPAAAEPVAAAQ